MRFQLVVEADLCGRPLTADGTDWVRVHAEVCDGHGTVYPFASDMPGKLIVKASIPGLKTGELTIESRAQ